MLLLELLLLPDRAPWPKNKLIQVKTISSILKHLPFFNRFSGLLSCFLFSFIILKLCFKPFLYIEGEKNMDEIIYFN